eukprot:376964_1
MLFALLIVSFCLWLPLDGKRAKDKGEFKNKLRQAIRGVKGLDDGDVDDYGDFVVRLNKLAKYDADDKNALKKKYKIFKETKQKNKERNENAKEVKNNGKTFKSHYGETEFADMTAEEIHEILFSKDEFGIDEADFTGKPGNGPNIDLNPKKRRLVTGGCTPLAANYFDVVDNYQGITNYHITPIKNQGQTRACWSFAAAAQFEANYKKYYGSAKVFSEQYVIDCTTTAQGSKAGGGFPERVGAVFEQQGACANYPYAWDSNRDLNGYCGCNAAKDYGYCYEFDGGSATGAQITKAATLYSFSFAMYLDDAFLSLKGDGVNGLVYNGCGSKKYAHAMAVVGQWYGNYVLVKNSWGSNWGDLGYVWIHTNALTQSCKWSNNPITIQYNFRTYAVGAHEAKSLELPEFYEPSNDIVKTPDFENKYNVKQPEFGGNYVISIGVTNILFGVVGLLIGCGCCLVYQSVGFSKTKNKYQTVSMHSSTDIE